MRFAVRENEDGMMLRTFLHRQKLSTHLVSHLKTVENGITVNGAHASVRKMLCAGDIVEVALEDRAGQSGLAAVPLPLTVLYEDEDLLAVSKPPHMPTHPSHGHETDTLANAVAAYFGDRPFVFRPIHRLDRDTSGVLVIAKNIRAASILSDSMAKGLFHKSYLAVAEGEAEVGTRFSVEAPLCRTEASIITRRVCEPDEPGAQDAVTDFLVVASGGGYSAFSAMPRTGRTHQIRVHLASIGHPIVGDGLYGKESPLIGRQALHALTLTFPLPSGAEKTLTAPIPPDIRALLAATGLSERIEKWGNSESFLAKILQ